MATELFDEDDDGLQAEVEKRIRELRQNPEQLLHRFDRNGDGVLDREEWHAARAVIRREVVTESDGREASPEVLAGRYRIVAPIGRGTQGHTRLAVDETTDEFVAVKELDFEMVGSWDAVEIFEREAAVLGGLKHPAIPDVVDTFHLEGETRHFLVQEFVDGDNLQMLLDDGSLFDEARLVRYARELVEILVYLHGYSPPVLHRDIKPANIIEQPDGSLALVDFGAAQGHGKQTAVIGTSGYMPPEQLMGRALPSSDLYALGATLIHLATAQHPTELQQDDLSLRWERFANLSDRFTRWLSRLVAPMPEDRFVSAVMARTSLEAKVERTPGGQSTAEEVDLIERTGGDGRLRPVSGRPSGCEVTVSRGGPRLEIAVPTDESMSPLARALIAGALALGGVALWYATDEWAVALVLFIAAGAVLFANGYDRSIRAIHGDERGMVVEAGREGIAERLPLGEIAGPELEAMKYNNHRICIVMRSGKKRRLYGIYPREDAEWLSGVIREWLVDHRMEQTR